LGMCRIGKAERGREQTESQTQAHDGSHLQQMVLGAGHGKIRAGGRRKAGNCVPATQPILMHDAAHPSRPCS
jgi:hypothetical protein